MADKLTPQQEKAVKLRGSMLLVSAAAGSGKTKVLVDRLMEYLTDPTDPANLDEFLIITYTKAAASELRGKIAAKLTEKIASSPENRHLQKQMQRLFLTKISTVHGFCADILREYAYRLDIGADFRVADENECREIRQTVMQSILEQAYESADGAFHAFADAQGFGRDDHAIVQIVEKVYDSAKCHLDPEGWLNGCLEAARTEDVTDASETIWGQYLIAEFKDYLSCQIEVMETCVERAQNCPGLEKQTINLKTTCNDLKTLADCETWDEIVSHRTIEYGRLVFPKKCEDPDLVEHIKAARNSCKKGLEKKLEWFTDPSEQVLSDLRQASDATQGLIALVRQFDREFSKAKKSRRCLDFSDLEHRTLDLLIGKTRGATTAAAHEIASRYREIMVDEYQDSNGVQDCIFSALSEKRSNCFMVGDVKQSIYQFRLADPEIFLKKYEKYASAEEKNATDGRKVLLSDNFRSGGEVIEAVNHVFASCMSPRVGGLYYGEGEALREGREHVPMPDTAVELYAVDVREDTYAEEAAFTARRIREMIDRQTQIRDGDGFRAVKADDIVILLRSPGSVGMHFVRALEQQGIRCASGGGEDLLQTPEIATLRSILQSVYNPRQDIPLLSALASPVFAFTADELAEIRSGRKKGYIYDALLASDTEKAQEFLRTLAQLRKLARMENLTRLIECTLASTRLDSIYAATDGGETRLRNLQTFYALAADFESGAQSDLGRFLEHLDALEEKGLTAAANASAGCVTIMSIHKSKGLEFPVVFLAGLGREFNREATRAQVLCDRELRIGLSVADHDNRVRYPSIAKRAIAAKMTKESLSEEMRVLYVALTRARDRLVMVYASRTLETDLREIALRADFGGELLCRDVVCPGEWVLKAAMERTEAGELFALGGYSKNSVVSEIPWKIAVVEGQPHISNATGAAEKTTPPLPEKAIHALEEALNFRYAHHAATQAPSKQTATQRKGREKDEEAAHEAKSIEYSSRNWRKPSFIQSKREGKAYGSAIHAVMQFVRYECCDSANGVKKEVRRLVEEGFIDCETEQIVNCEAIAAFFRTEVGKKLRTGTQYLREFKFSILDDATHYGENLQHEKVLLQGVVDCALIEDDGITVLDFKTDAVTEETIDSTAERYRLQVETYADALSRIYEMPIKQKLLYFFRLGKFAEISS